MFKIMTHLHKNIIHMGKSKFHGFMLSLIFHFLCGAISLQIEVRPIIIWLIAGGVSVLGYKWIYVVVSDNMCVPIIEVSIMEVKKEDLWIDIYI